MIDMVDELIEHRHTLKRLNLDAEFLRDKIFKEFEGKDGFGTTTKDHIQIWLQTLYESLESLEYVYQNLMQIINQF